MRRAVGPPRAARRTCSPFARRYHCCVQAAFCAFALVLIGLATGCATSSEQAPVFGPRPPAETLERLPFLRNQITTQAECEARLGPPAAVFGSDRTWGYVFVGTKSGGLRLGSADNDQPADLTDTRHKDGLVLTFDADGRLTRLTLIEKPGLDVS